MGNENQAHKTGPWMLKGERDPRDRTLKCMVRGILMTEFREVEVFEPLTPSPIVMHVLYTCAHMPM